MSAERANDKCERCGKKFSEVQLYAAFIDELYCSKCNKEVPSKFYGILYPERDSNK